jgi:hypothetical protein
MRDGMAEDYLPSVRNADGIVGCTGNVTMDPVTRAGRSAWATFSVIRTDKSASNIGWNDKLDRIFAC